MAPQERRDRAITAHYSSSPVPSYGTLMARAVYQGTSKLFRRARTPSFLNRVSQVRILPGARRSEPWSAAPSARRGATRGANASFARAAQHRIRLASEDQLTHLDLEILGCASGLGPSRQLEHETPRPTGRGQQHCCTPHGGPVPPRL